MNVNYKTNILFASAEVAPFAKVGGLGDVAGSLPEALNKLESQALDLRIIMPFHAQVRRYNPEHRQIGTFGLVMMDGTELPCQVYLAQIGETIVYLLDNEYINHNSPVYHGDWRLDGMKYVSFSLMVLEAAKYLDWKPDILHCNDWHTALSVTALKQQYVSDPFFLKTKTILSIHNLPFNGWGSQDAMSALGFKPSTDQDLPDWAKFTPLPMGIADADLVMTVSPGYAEEITTPQFGCGLENYLQKHQEKLMGILNGIDVESYNPKTDKALSYPFNVDRLYEKQLNKAEIQAEYGLEIGHHIPLITMVSRLGQQKGLHILIDGLEQLVDLPWQFILLGTGEKELEEKVKAFAERFPDKFVAIIKYDDTLARKLYAAGDIFTMPSLYEPCGLSQMIAMRYGNLPVASATGGLRNSILDYTTHGNSATGFLVYDITANSFSKSLRLALTLFKDKTIWTELQRNAMNQDFSWKHSAVAYEAVYNNVLKNKEDEG